MAELYIDAEIQVRNIKDISVDSNANITLTKLARKNTLIESPRESISAVNATSTTNVSAFFTTDTPVDTGSNPNDDGIIVSSDYNYTKVADHTTHDPIVDGQNPSNQVYARLTYSQSSGTGTVAVTNGSANVVGTSSLFTTEFAVGDIFIVNSDGTAYIVDTITDDTHLSLTSNYSGTTSSGEAITQKRWSANYFSLIAGVETAFTWTANTTIDIICPQNVNMFTMPRDAIVGMSFYHDQANNQDVWNDLDIDTLFADVYTTPSRDKDGNANLVTPLETQIYNHINSTTAHNSNAIVYNNTTSGLTATDVQAAIDELADSADTNLNPITVQEVGPHTAGNNTLPGGNTYVQYNGTTYRQSLHIYANGKKLFRGYDYVEVNTTTYNLTKTHGAGIVFEFVIYEA